jgi:hypothetical protein
LSPDLSPEVIGEKQNNSDEFEEIVMTLPTVQADNDGSPKDDQFFDAEGEEESGTDQ